MPKKYTVNVENDQVISTEIDGVKYQRLDQIQNKKDRARLRRMTAHIFGQPKNQGRVKKEEEDKGPDVTLIVFGVFLGVSILMFLIAGIFGVAAGRAVAKEQSTPGQVVDMVPRKDSDGNLYYYPVVEVSLSNGSVQEVQITEGSWPAAYVIGEPVTVAYDPEEMQNARIRSLEGDMGRWLVTLITGFMGIAFAGAAGFAYWMSKQDIPDPDEDMEGFEEMDKMMEQQ